MTFAMGQRLRGVRRVWARCDVCETTTEEIDFGKLKEGGDIRHSPQFSAWSFGDLPKGRVRMICPACIRSAEETEVVP